MRLLTVGSLPPEWGGPVRGGAATFHAALLTELLKRDWEVEVVGVMPPGPLDREIPVPVWPRPDDIARPRFYEQLLERLRPDVVLMSHFAHTYGVTHARLGSPVPTIGVAHSWHNVTFRSGEERERAVDITTEALSGLTALVAVSHHTLEEGRRLGFEYPAMAETIHNPVPPLYMEKGVDVDGGDRDGVLYLGSLIARKEPGALVEAAAMDSAIGVTLAGEGELEQALRARIGSLGLAAGRVRFADLPRGDGHLPAVRDLLLRSRAMCLPSRGEGLPLAFVEALACGTPIVGFGPAVREIRDELGIEVGEPLDGGAPEEVGAAIERVLGTEWDREGLRRAALARFGLDRVTDRYVELLGRVARGRDSGRGASEEEPTAVCVLGPSRSGSSLTTRVLSLAGVYLGPEEELLAEEPHQLAGEGERVLEKARDSNPSGHWEHYRLMRLNERILKRFGGSWRDPPSLPSGWEDADGLEAERVEARELLGDSFGGQDLWGWKDPRNSLTLPFWQGLVPRMRYVICLRHPIDVALSLWRRDGIDLVEGVELWLRYLASALVHTSGRPRLLVAYESYFDDPAAVGACLARFAGRAGALDGAEGKRRLTGAVDRRLWRNRVADREPADADFLSPRARCLYRTARLLAAASARDVDAPAAVTEFDAAADLQAEEALGGHLVGG